MKKNGFTLVELLAVIVILALLITIAVPNIIGISNKIKKNMFCEKVSSIESAAKLYAQDMYSDDAVSGSNEVILASDVTIKDLIDDGYLKKDDDKCDFNTVYCIKDPRDNSQMDYNYIQIYTKNKRVYARYLYNSADASSKICGEDKIYKTN